MDVENDHSTSMDEDYEDGYSGDEGGNSSAEGSSKYPMWLPPGADCSGDDATFASNFEDHFIVPDRLADKSASVVEAVNDFHFAMINDHARNCFYRSALQKAITPGDLVLEIGTGSGLLAMLAARAGAGHVYAIEANRNMADLAVQLIKVPIMNILSRNGVPLFDACIKEDLISICYFRFDRPCAHGTCHQKCNTYNHEKRKLHHFHQRHSMTTLG